MFSRNQRLVDNRAAAGRKAYDDARRIGAYRSGAEERKAKAEEKRARKAAKRARGAEHTALGETCSRYRLETGLIAGFIRDKHELPCGECHLQPNEVCDICGRKAAP